MPGIFIESDEFTFGIQTLRAQPGVRSARSWRSKWGHMVEVAVVFVVAQDEDGLLPYFGIMREDVQDFGDVPGAVPGCNWMVGKVFGSDDPRHGRQSAGPHILTKLVEHIALRYSNRALDGAVHIFHRCERMIVDIVGVRCERPLMDALLFGG